MTTPARRALGGVAAVAALWAGLTLARAADDEVPDAPAPTVSEPVSGNTPAPSQPVPAAPTATVPGANPGRPTAATPPATPPVASLAVPQPSAADLALVRDAVTAYRRGDVPAGDALRNRTESAGAKAFLDWTALRLGGAAIPFDRVAAFALAYPDFPNASAIRRRGEDALMLERRTGPVLRAFFARERPQTPAGKVALAQALRADGLTEDADSLIRDAWRNDPFGRDVEARILEAFPNALTTADHRFRMERFLLKENWEVGRRAAGYAGGAYDTLVKARLAVDTRSRMAPKVVDQVPAALRPDTSWLFSRVQNLRRTEKAGDAARAMAELTRDPAILAEGDAWWVERRIVARKLLDDGDPKAAYAVASRHGAATMERRVEAEFLAGWIALRSLNEPATARRHFDRAAALATAPQAQARSAYWQGRAAEAAGLAAEARGFYEAGARFGITYYGQLAGARLGGASVQVRAPGERTGEERRKAAQSPVAVAVAVAYAAGFRELGLPLAIEFGRGSTSLPELELVADILTANNDIRAVLTVGKLATARGVPLDEAAFPVTGIPPFQEIGRPVELAMVHAIARQESAFDPSAGSGAGARGLMQMMPGTAVATARRANVIWEPGRLLEGSYNASLGAAHLGDLMDDWKGSLILVFAAYNAGPGNVRKWIVASGDPRQPGVDPIDWVERIPFSETRNYVQRVLENLQVYRQRLRPGESRLLTEIELKGGGAATGGLPPPTTVAATGPAAPGGVAP